MKLKCIRDVVMIPDGDIAFKAGNYYDFHLKDNGEISRYTEAEGIHMFRAFGPDSWPNYFVKELEEI